MCIRDSGFDTSVETAAMAIKGAHVEATGAPWGIGMVKVMGRDAGFIALAAMVLGSLAALEHAHVAAL